MCTQEAVECLMYGLKAQVCMLCSFLVSIGFGLLLHYYQIALLVEVWGL